MPKKSLTKDQQKEILSKLEERFNHSAIKRDENLEEWKSVKKKLVANPDKIWSLYQMEETGGEPNVVKYDREQDCFYFFDCSAESPTGRRSLCYDREALESRKKNKPSDSAIDMASAMGVKMLNEEEYRYLQSIGEFDLKTSTWVETPTKVRELGGSIFCDRRFDRVFTYHNGASSYYASRGFRSVLVVS